MINNDLKGIIVLFVYFFASNESLAEMSSRACSEHICISCNVNEKTYFSNLQINFGSSQNVFEELVKISKGEMEDKFDEDFYKTYGVYFLKVKSSYSDAGLVAKHLFDKGVHPYWSLHDETPVAFFVLINGDLESFKVMIDSGKLEDCPEILTELKRWATKLNESEKLRLLNKL